MSEIMRPMEDTPSLLTMGPDLFSLSYLNPHWGPRLISPRLSSTPALPGLMSQEAVQMSLKGSRTGGTWLLEEGAGKELSFTALSSYWAAGLSFEYAGSFSPWQCVLWTHRAL
jgi:hypothetical protein